jgi:arylsulfatase
VPLHLLGVQRFEVAGVPAVPAGTHQVRMGFDDDDGALAKGGTLSVDVGKVGGGSREGTAPMPFSVDEGADVGSDAASTVSDDHTAGDLDQLISLRGAVRDRDGTPVRPC